MRRSISRIETTHGLSNAVERYIAERELKRHKITNIPQHRKYQPSDRGLVFFAGIRKVNEEFIVLLQRQKQIIVLPIDAMMIPKLKKLSLNAPVNLTAKGALRVKGRIR